MKICRTLASAAIALVISVTSMVAAPATASTNAVAKHESISAKPSLTLRRGSSGLAVAALQISLTNAGWPTRVDGVYGAGTERSVRRFQKANGLKVDGVAGPKTLRKLGLVISPEQPRYHHPNPDVDRWWDEALRAGWSSAQWPVIACIMEHPVYKNVAESRGIPTVHNTRYPDDSYGLLQLNMRAHRSWAGPMVGWDFSRLFDGETNLRVAHRLFEMARGWSPWRSGWQRGTCFSLEGSLG